MFEEKERVLEEIKTLRKERKQLFDEIYWIRTLTSIAWDGYYALTEHLNALEEGGKKSRDFFDLVGGYEDEFKEIVDKAKEIMQQAEDENSLVKPLTKELLQLTSKLAEYWGYDFE